MNSSILLQTEIQCVPTQWIIFDLTPDLQIKKWVSSSPLAEDCIDLLTIFPTKNKQTYIQMRPKILQDFDSMYDKRIKQGSRGRLVMWFVGDISNPSSTLLLRELPLDISNFAHWKHKFFPGVIRIAMGPGSSHKPFLLSLIPQYFGQPSDFTQNTDESRLTDSKLQVQGNVFDSTLIASTMDPIIELLNALAPLHHAETLFARKYRSDRLGAGGKLFVIENALVASVCGWRQVDWLVLAQTNFFPRLWVIDIPAMRRELIQLLDYKQWKARFQKLNKEELNDMDIDLEDPKEDPSSQFQRRKRESHWNHLTKDLPANKQRQLKLYENLLVDEPNEYRITEGDFLALKELITCLQRRNQFELSSKLITLFGTPPLPFLKLEGIAYLQLNMPHKSKAILKSYREQLLIDWKQKAKTTQPTDTLKAEAANVYSEVASIALLEGTHAMAPLHIDLVDDCEAAREFALQALQEAPNLSSALKTLTWTSTKTGVTTFEQEDQIFRFLLSCDGPNDITINGALMANPNGAANDYYTSIKAQYPHNPIYMYYIASYHSLITKSLDEADSHYLLSLKGLPDNPRVLESYATFLFQNGMKKKKTAPQQAKLFTKIEGLYRKAMACTGESPSLVLKANFAAFLLATTFESGYKKSTSRHPNSKSSSSSSDSEHSEPQPNRKQEGLSLLDAVLYSTDLNEVNPQLAIECWFYAIIYKPTQFYFEALQNIKTCLKGGARATDSGWLPKLAEVAVGNALPSCLLGWDRWSSTRCTDVSTIKTVISSKGTSLSCFSSNAAAAPVTTSYRKTLANTTQPTKNLIHNKFTSNPSFTPSSKTSPKFKPAKPDSKSHSPSPSPKDATKGFESPSRLLLTDYTPSPPSLELEEDPEIFRKELFSQNPKQPNLFKRRKIELSSDSESEDQASLPNQQKKRKALNRKTELSNVKKPKFQGIQKENENAVPTLSRKDPFLNSTDERPSFSGFLDQMKPTPPKMMKTYSTKK